MLLSIEFGLVMIYDHMHLRHQEYIVHQYQLIDLQHVMLHPHVQLHRQASMLNHLLTKLLLLHLLPEYN